MKKELLQELVNERMKHNIPHKTENDKRFAVSLCTNYNECKHHNIQIVIAIEEISELIQQLSKLKRGKIDGEDISLIEEIGDVDLSLYFIIVGFCYYSSEVFDINFMRPATQFDIGDNDVVFTAISSLLELSSELSSILLNERDIEDLTTYRVLSKIAFAYKCIRSVMLYYQVDTEKVFYCEDIKLERDVERCKTEVDSAGDAKLEKELEELKQTKV
jgi:hypothetical protein